MSTALPYCKKVKVKSGYTNQKIFYIVNADYKLLFHFALVGLQLKFSVHFWAPLFQINMHELGGGPGQIKRNKL